MEPSQSISKSRLAGNFGGQEVQITRLAGVPNRVSLGLVALFRSRIRNRRERKTTWALDVSVAVCDSFPYSSHHVKTRVKGDRMPKAQKSTEKTYQFKITLVGTSPAVWRRILVEPSTTLGELHYIIQAVMPWEDYHLHQFRIGKKFYGDPETDDFGSQTLDEWQIDVGALHWKKIRRFSYEYDFGDSWEHTIEFEKIVPRRQEMVLPFCLDGHRACPLEDSGGPWGFSDKLKILRDPKNEDYERIKEWMGDFDPNNFSITAANDRLRDSVLEEVAEVDDELITIFQAFCGWCDSDIDEEQEVFSQGIHLNPDFDLKSHEGRVVPIQVSGKNEPLLCLIPTENSEARKAGSEGTFQLCSEKCVYELRAALKAEISSYSTTNPQSELTDP